jgi:hypothetical protein
MKRMASFTALSDLTLHCIGEEGLLLDPMRQRLYALNSCATFIWNRLKGGSSPEEASRSLSERYALSPETAVSYVTSVLQQYEVLSGKEASLSDRTLVHRTMPISRTGRYDGSFVGEVVRTYRLLDSVFRLHFSIARLVEAIHPLLEPLAVTHAADGADVVDLAIVLGDERILVVADRQVVGSASNLTTVAVAVRACLTQLAAARSGGFCVAHAGALRRNGAALLLPGGAGYGKSTLSAGLATQGFEMLCDDTTLLLGEPLAVRSMPSGLCIKRGAYAVLERRLAGLSSLPERRRPDGQRARYLMPGRDLPWAAADAVAAVRWIVFPRYRPDGGTELRRLARHEALAQLLRGVCFLSGALDAVNLDRFVAWVASIDCFDLPLASLDDATALIDELCS